MRRFGVGLLAVGAALLLSACAGKTAGTTHVTDVSATLHATGRCDSGETCTWYWEYWPASQPRSATIKTPVQGPVTGPTGDRSLSTDITGLSAGAAYRWVFCASPNNGADYACAGPHGTFGATTADPPADFAKFTTAAWRIQTTPTPSGATSSFLGGVSCTSAKACIAVGGYTNSAGIQVTLAERWDGRAWTIQPTPNPTGAEASALSGVSCTSATVCIAVGNYTDSAGTELTLAERWDGTAWMIQATPNPTGALISALYGVSCTAATACTAVGNYANSAGGTLLLTERWDGTAWAIQPTPNPDAPQNVLSGVSCTPATACIAVGADNSAGTNNYVTLAEQWDGTAWTIQATPNPTGVASSALVGVSCTSPTACAAVGSNENGLANFATLGERWDGTAWTIQQTIDPAGRPGRGLGSSLSGVSCKSTTACTAVGGYQFLDSNGPQTLAEHWDGTNWKIQTTLSGGRLGGVSCTSASVCTAVGSSNGVTLAERYSR